MDRNARPQMRNRKIPQSQEEFIRMVEELNRINKGRFTNIASDTSSNQPSPLYSARVNPGTIAFGTPVEGQDPTLPKRKVEQIPTYQSGEQYDSNGSSYQDFFNMLGSVGGNQDQYGGYSGQEEVYQKTQLPYAVQTLQDGGIKFNDGSIKYQDGTIRSGDNVDPSAYGIRTNEDGSVQYSDGSVRRQPTGFGELASQETVPPENFKDFEGVGGLSNFVFGENRNVTQPYGNYNPNRFYNINQGIDFQTVGQDNNILKLPVDVQVVEISKWDGLAPDQTSTPYGNSILVKLPNGSFLRLSHLDQYAELQPGDTIKANEEFATTGATGNTTGPHLDVEYYNEKGQISDPKDFFLAVQKQTEAPTQEKIQSLPTDNPIQQQDQQQTQPQPQDPGMLEKAASFIEEKKPTGNLGLGLTEFAKNDIQGGKEEIANTINTLNPTGQSSSGGLDLGVTENLQNNPELAKLKQEETKKNISNVFSDIIAKTGSMAGLKERKISELFKIPSVVQSVEASDGKIPQNDLQSQQDVVDFALNQAGQGLSGLKNIFNSVVSKVSPVSLADMDTRKIGGSPSASANPDLMMSSNKMQSTAPVANVFSKIASPGMSTVSAASTTAKPIASTQTVNTSQPVAKTQTSSPQQSSSSNQSNSNQNKSNQNSSPAPQQSKAPAPVYQTPAPKPVYQTPAPKPVYQTPAPKPAPKPAPAPAPKQNVFSNLVNTIKSWFKW